MTTTTAKKKIWLPGGRGMLGHALQQRLRDHDVVVTGSDVDIADEAVVFAFVDAVRPDVVVNCAAYTAVDKAEAEEAAAVRVNGVGAGVVGRAAARVGARAVHVSTDYVFDGTSKERWSPDDVTGPLSAYGRSKREGEVRFLEGTHGKGLVVRTSWLFGPGNKNFVTTMLKLMSEREELRVVADQHGRPTSTATLADVCASFGVDVVDVGGVVHCADAGETTWHAFAVAIKDGAAARGLPLVVKRIDAITTEQYPTPARRPRFSILDCARTEQLLGRPLPPWTTTLGSYLDVLSGR